MRFERIDLTAYGNFTNKSLDLSDPAKTVHVIYGPNEAGKSTVKNAIEELLFGFNGQTKFNFKHPYPAMALGATLANTAGARISFVRRKRARGSDLFTLANEQVSAAVLTPYVGGLTRDAYENQFCLSRKSLIDGSTEIANGTGEVGENLYNAALGNTSLHDIIARLEKQRDDLFTSGARTKPLNAAITAYETQRQAARAFVVRPEEWQRIVGQRDTLAAQIADIESQIGELAALTGLLTSLRACYPNYDRLRLARAALLEAADEPRMAPDVVQAVADLLKDLDEAEREIARCGTRIARLGEMIGPDQVDPLIPHRAVIDGLKGRVNTYRKNFADLQDRDLRGHARRNAEAAQRDLDSVWPGLALDEARKRVITQDAQTRGNALVLDLVRLGEQCRNAVGAERALLDQIADVDGELAELAATRDLNAMRATVAAAAADGRLDTDVSQSDGDVAQAAKAAATTLAALGLYPGSLAGLEAAALPLAATVDRHDGIFDDLRAREERNDERREDARAKHADACEQLDAMAREGDIHTLADLTAARADRDGRFVALKERWQGGAAIPDLDAAAGEYEPAVVGADRIADTLRQQAERVTRVATLEAQRDAADAEIARLAEERTAIATDRTAADGAWEAEWAPLQVAPMPPAEMRAWLQDAHEVRRLAVEADEAVGARDELIARRSRLRSELVDVLQAVGGDIPAGETIEPILGIARDVLAAADQIELTRTRLSADKARHNRSLSKLRRDTAAAEGDLAAATTAFAAILERVWLPADLPAAGFANTLSAVASFHTADRRARDDKARADGIDRDNAAFRDAVVAFAHDHAPDLEALAGPSPDVVTESLGHRLATATTAFDHRAALLEQLASERTGLTEETDKRDLLAIKLAAILAREGITRDVLPARLDRSRILNTHADTVVAETEHLEIGTGLTLTKCDLQYGDRDRAALDRDLAVTNGRIERLTGERNSLNPALWELNERLRRMDGSSAAADAQTTLAALGATVDHEARRWIEVSLALHVLKEQIREYAEAHQGAVIVRASHYLSILTNGAYEKLRAVNDGERNVLEAVHQDGRGLEIEALSEGTRDQLFLALRLAALEEYLKNSEPQPLILDDTFIAFDDTRTERAFRALAEIAGQTQVLYFTHHAACVDAARACVPAEQLAVHDLHDDVGADAGAPALATSGNGGLTK
jgi:uncharacterized protein YhaN